MSISIRALKKDAFMGHYCYNAIKVLLKSTKPLNKFLFWCMVGPTRYKDYTYFG